MARKHVHRIAPSAPVTGTEDGNGFFYVDVQCLCGQRGWLTVVEINSADVDWSAGTGRENA